MFSMQRVPAWLLAGAGGAASVLGFFFISTFPGIAVGLGLLGAGAAIIITLVPEISLLLWFGSAITAGVGVALMHTLLRAFIPLLSTLPFLPSLLGFSVLIAVFGAVAITFFKWTRTVHAWSVVDGVFLLALIPVLASTLLVSARNGYVPGPDGRTEFHARGFVNGDTMTLFALTQATGSRQQTVGLLRENPFAGNGELEYPTLLHRALADVLTATGGDITRAAWWLIVPVLFGNVGVSALSASVIFRGQRVPLWAVVLLLVAYGSTWESFTYPQSHTFLTGIFVLFVLLLVRRDQCEHAAERRLLRFAIGGSALVLLFSNAVLGSAAVAVAVGSNLLQLFNWSWPRRDKLSGLIGSAILLILFFLFPPGAGALGALNVAYTAFPQFLTAAVLAAVVLWALWDTAWLHRSPGLLGAAVLLPALSFVTLVFSERDIIAENSPRFLFLLVLIGWPAVIPLVQRIADWWWRQVCHVEHSVAELAVLWGGGAFTLVVLLLPAGASVAGTLDILVRKPPLVVSADELAAFAWIRENTKPDDVFARAPWSLFENKNVAPLSLPAFTGRAQLRAEYWLSPEDDQLSGVQTFFRRETNAVPPADYLFCGSEILTCPHRGTRVFTRNAVEIVFLRNRQ